MHLFRERIQRRVINSPLIGQTKWNCFLISSTYFGPVAMLDDFRELLEGAWLLVLAEDVDASIFVMFKNVSSSSVKSIETLLSSLSYNKISDDHNIKPTYGNWLTKRRLGKKEQTLNLFCSALIFFFKNSSRSMYSGNLRVNSSSENLKKKKINTSTYKYKNWNSVFNYIYVL